jgi:Domain of unknown function (DUF4438)
MVSDNRSQLIGVSVQGTISSPEYPALPASPYIIGADGQPTLLPSPGGIVYNVRVGDSAFGWLADMVQPGVSIRNSQDGANHALNVLACIGNEAVVVSGRATGARGTVIGKSGRFAEHVIVDFAPEVLVQLAIEDRILIRAHGRSLALTEYHDVHLKSISPHLLDVMGIQPAGEQCLCVPVVAEAPAFLVGAGSGLLSESGCVQLQTDHREALERHRLDHLRLGDVVAIRDYDSRYGNGYRQGAMTIGVVVHGDSPRAGYGPGVTVIMTAINGRIQTAVVTQRNIAALLGLRASVPEGA